MTDHGKAYLVIGLFCLSFWTLVSYGIYYVAIKPKEEFKAQCSLSCGIIKSTVEDGKCYCMTERGIKND
jgi:hypothetical protein